MTLLRERAQVLLPSLKRLYLGVCRSLEVHAEPKNRHDQTGNSRGDILSHL